MSSKLNSGADWVVSIIEVLVVVAFKLLAYLISALLDVSSSFQLPSSLISCLEGFETHGNVGWPSSEV